MTLHIEKLIENLGNEYNSIFEAGIIPYKTIPKGFPGDPILSLNMAREGVCLSFSRDRYILLSIDLNIQNNKIKSWKFPNELPFGLKCNMNLKSVHDELGIPLKTLPSKFIMNSFVGRADLYSINGFHLPISLQIRYDDVETIKSLSI
ncbi:pyocin immunity protein, partial [Salmonella enterica]|nr:pyocin immunity protein [Salmonella enterica]